MISFVKFATTVLRGFQACPDNLPLERPGIYAIVNIESGKLYIGMSKNIADRMRRHSGGMSPKKLRNTIKKHGKEKFMIIPIYYSITGLDHLHELEADMISSHDSIRHGYNIQATRVQGLPYGEAFSAMLSEALNRPEVKAKFVARWTDPEIKERHREKMREVLSNQELRARLSASGSAAHGTQEMRESASAKAKAAHARSEVRARYDEALYNNPEAQERRRLGWIAAHANHDRTKRKTRVDSKTGFRGVRRLPGGRYQAIITIDKKQRSLGTFDTAEEAHDAYLASARALKPY